MTAMLAIMLGGTAVAMLVFALWTILAEAKSGDIKVYRDDPPRLFKLFWPLILVAGGLVSRLLQPAREAKILARLKKGGVDYALTPRQFLSGKIVYGLFGMGLFWMIGSVFKFSALGCMLVGLLLGYVYPDVWLNEKAKQRRLALLKALPFFLDILTLAVESGLNLAGAIQKAVEKTQPGPLTCEMNQVMRDVRAGRARVDALRDLSERLEFAPVSSLVSALVQGELTGSSLGPILRAQSDQRRSERFQRAEKMAMEAPVKMLAPLVMFIFPCTFVVIGFPIVVKFLSSGI